MTVKMEFTFSNGTKKSVGKSYIYMPGLPISVAIAALPYTTPVMDKKRSFGGKTKSCPVVGRVHTRNAF